MALLDFLWNGSPPPNISSFQSTSVGIPDWVAQYQQGILAKGNALASVPADQYFAGRPPSVAPFSADQNAAFDKTRANVGSTQPMYGQANQFITGAGNTNPLALGQGYLQNAGNINIPNAAQPYLDSASGYNASDAAQPYLNSATGTWPGAAANYMSPYTSGVTDEIARLGGRNLSENLLPAVNDTFTGAGQFGSRRHADFTGRALRDTNESILGQQSLALQQGYNQSAQIFGQDQSRLAGLGATAGQLADTTRGGLASLGQLSGQLQQSQGALQSQVGSGLGNLGVADAASQLAAGQGLGNLASQQQGSQLRDAASLEAVGQTQQGQVQQNLNAAGQNWMEERDYDKNNATYLNSLLRGLQVPTSTTQQYTGPGQVYQPSPLAQIAQGLGTYGALKNVI